MRALPFSLCIYLALCLLHFAAFPPRHRAWRLLSFSFFLVHGCVLASSAVGGHKSLAQPGHSSCLVPGSPLSFPILRSQARRHGRPQPESTEGGFFFGRVPTCVQAGSRNFAHPCPTSHRTSSLTHTYDNATPSLCPWHCIRNSMAYRNCRRQRKVNQPN